MGNQLTTPNIVARIRSRINDFITASCFDLSQLAERKRSIRELENLFFTLFDQCDVDCFIEIGARDAHASRKIATEYPHLQVIAFEANPFTYKRWINTHDFEAIGVDYRHQALSHEKGNVEIHVRKNENGNPMADGQGSLLQHTTYPHGHLKVSVKADTLKSVAEEIEKKNSVYWIDVEGAQQSVLSGADPFLSNVQLVFVEVETKEIWSGQWIKKDVDDFFKRAGFFPLARDFHGRFQCNVVYLPVDRVDAPGTQRALIEYRKKIAQIDGNLIGVVTRIGNLLGQLSLFQKVRKKAKKTFTRLARVKTT